MAYFDDGTELRALPSGSWPPGSKPPATIALPPEAISAWFSAVRKVLALRSRYRVKASSIEDETVRNQALFVLSSSYEGVSRVQGTPQKRALGIGIAGPLIQVLVSRLWIEVRVCTLCSSYPPMIIMSPLAREMASAPFTS